MGWELDVGWAFELRRRLASPSAAGKLRIVVADALAIPWAVLPAGTLVAGNLPYQIGTVLIRRLLGNHERIPRAAFLVQKEVAERLAADPGSRAYGALSVAVAAQARIRILGRVRPGSFRPPPKVESAFVGLTLKAPPLDRDEMPAFLGLVQDAFSQRRKTLRNALASTRGRAWAEEVLEAAELPPQTRAEALGLESFLELHAAARSLSGRRPAAPSEA